MKVKKRMNEIFNDVSCLVVFFGILILTIALTYSLISGSVVFALPPDQNYGNPLDCEYRSADPGGTTNTSNTCSPYQDMPPQNDEVPSLTKVPESNRTLFYDNSTDAKYDTFAKFQSKAENESSTERGLR